MTEPQGMKENVKFQTRVCPSCRRESDLALTACWKCGAVFENETGGKKAGPSRSFLVPASLVLVAVFLAAALVLAKRLTPVLSGAPGAAKEDRAAGREAPAKTEDPWKVRSAPDLEKIYPAPGGPGAYRFLVTNVPQDPAGEKSTALYFDGLIGTYLRSNTGAKLVAKRELMLGDQYRAVEYKIGFPYPEGGRMQPFIHHAVAAVIDGKAYAVSADAPQALSEDGVAMKEHLLNSIRVAQGPRPEKNR
jgi:hypothetical protein